MNTITREIIDKSYSYKKHNEYIEELFAADKTTNNVNTEANLGYTKLNISRVNRLDKRAKLNVDIIEAVQNIKTPQIWLVLSEGWCGDSAQILPYVNKMDELNDLIEFRIIFRDEHPEVMDAFLTNGKSRSIPKFIFLDAATLDVLGTWGPRPKVAHDRYMTEKEDPAIGQKKASENMHLWYTKNKGEENQKEFLEVLKKL